MPYASELGEFHGFLFDYDLETIERLVGFASQLGLPDDSLITVGCTVDSSEFDDECRDASSESLASAIIRSNGRRFAVIQLAKPLVHGICQVEIIEAKTPIPFGEYVGVNQIHYVIPKSDFLAVYQALPPDITGAPETRFGSFTMARIDAGQDTHIKIRDHSAMDLVLHSIGDVAARQPS